MTIAEEIARFHNGLDELNLRRIVDQQLHGWTDRETTLPFGPSIRRIERKLQRVRVFWIQKTTP